MAEDYSVAIQIVQQGMDKVLADSKRFCDQFTANFSKLTKNSSTQAQQVSKHWEAGFALLSVYGLQAAKKISAAFQDLIGTFADFEQSLANTFSIVGDAGPETLNLLEDAARRVGATTRATASEAANALYYLASAGFSAKESVEALDGVNALAIATQSDLAKSSEFVATTVRQFSLATSDATGIANTFTAAITSSLATVDKLRNAFEYVGPIAGGLGHTVEETTGALQVLFNQGFSGEKAGRALRRVLVDLADSSSLVNKRLNNLGITFDEVNPATNSIADIVEVLADNYVDASNSAAIFGKISGAQVAALINSGANSIREMTEAVTGTNKAFEAMDIQMDTLQGSIDKYKNAAEAFKISTGSAMEAPLRALIDTATDVILALNEIPGPIKAIGAAVALGSAGVIALTTVVSGLATAMGIAGASFTALLGPIGLIIAGLAGITAAVVAINKAVDNHREEHLKELEKAYGDLSESLGVSADDMEEFAKKASALDDAFSRVDISRVGNSDKLKNYLQQMADYYGLTFEQVVKLANANEKFVEKAGPDLVQLTKEVEAQEEAYRKQKEELDELRKGYLAYAEGRVAAVLALKEAEGKQTETLDESSKVLLELDEKIKNSYELQKLLGKGYDGTSARISAYEDAVTTLVEELGLESDVVKDLMKDYSDLAKAYADAAFESDYEKRLKIQQQLEKDLAALVERQKVAKLSGEEFNYEVERSNLVLAALDELITNGFTMEGSGIKDFMDEYGEFIKKAPAETKDMSNEIQSYKEKLEELGKSSLEASRLERARAIEGAEGNYSLIAAINAYYDAYDKILKQAEEQEAWESTLDTISSVTDGIMSFFDAINDFAQVSFEKQLAQEEELLAKKLATIETTTNAKLAEIDAEEQRALEAAGVLEETTLERLQRELAEAQAAGDTETAAELEDEIKRLEIKEKYAKERAAAEQQAIDDKAAAEELAQEKIADIQYKADLAEHANTLLQTTAAAALAVIKAAPNAAAMAAMGVIGAIQVAAVAAAKPQPPEFENGGIVPGSSFTGDNIIAGVNSGELIMNKAQQNNIASQLISQDRPIEIHSHIYISGKQVSEEVVRNINNGITPLRARS